MKHRLLLIGFLLITPTAQGAPSPQVPAKMKFAGMKLRISRAARHRIQEKVDSLVKSDKYFQELVKLVNLFMPIVERILQEEGLPEDFKYQIIQESAMVSDAVHVSNTVGFWQFKANTALEVGLKIDSDVDERMHIVAATRGAAKYLKKNNQHLENWLYALLAYNQGLGYVKKLRYQQHRGATSMKVLPDTHWYIIHFLAHKVVFEHIIGKTQHPELYLHEYEEAHGKSLHEISQEFGIDHAQLKAYNKWLKSAKVPHDTDYPIIIPLKHQQSAPRRQKRSLKAEPVDQRLRYDQYWESAEKFPVITLYKTKKADTPLKTINGIPGIQAQPGDTLSTIAQAGNLSLDRLLAYNDITADHQVIPGQVYYCKSKYSRAAIHFHIAREGETWWSIAQKYGLKKAALLTKNRLRKEVPLKPGRVLWLRFIRPAKVPVAYEYR